MEPCNVTDDDIDDGPDLDSVADCEEKTVDSRGWGHEREQMEEIRAWLKSKEKKDPPK